MNAHDHRLTPEQRDGIRALIDDAMPATAGLLTQIAQSVRDVREHDHTTQREDWFCMNLTSYMGGKAGPVLRRLLDAEARVVELEATEQRVRNALAPRWDLAPEAQAVVSTALSDSDHVHEYRDFGPYAGSRCVECNQPHAEVGKDTPIGGESTRASDELVIYRAEHDSIPFGLYATRAAARAHCEAYARRESLPVDGSLGWVPEDGSPDAVEELSVFWGPREDPSETCTGYTVTPLTVADDYDPEADQ